MRKGKLIDSQKIKTNYENYMEYPTIYNIQRSKSVEY